MAVYRRLRCVHVILDNDGIHKSAVVAGCLRSVGEKLKLHFLPPYCPDDNRIERIWEDVHGNVTRIHRRTNLRDLLDDVRVFLGDRFELFVGVCINV